jgi:hypothetical protein
MTIQELTYRPSAETIPESPTLEYRPTTPWSYLLDILDSARKHSGEIAIALMAVTFITLSAFWMIALLNLRPFRGPALLLSLLMPALMVVLLCEAAVAAWRVHHRQHLVMATSRSLVDLNTRDRMDLERFLLARHHREEARMEERHVSDVARLTEKIAALEAR